MSGKSDNERKACDAVARCLEDISGFARKNAHSPEDDKIGPRVEYVFDLGGRKYALEHTIVEAFENQINSDVDFEKFFAPISDALDYQMPSPGKYDLSFVSINPSKGLKSKNIPKLQASIIEWVKMRATELHGECPDQPARKYKPRGHKNFRRGTVDGVELLLYRETDWWVPDKAMGRLFCARFAPKDYEALRLERLGRAMNKKLPKLQAWRSCGARSVLVLESGDKILSNHIAILEGTEHALKGRSDQPDEVWLVDTAETEWTVWCLIRDGVSFPDEDK